jgi:pimeloyl-ACP methyl ester carboxylesterase
VVIPVISVTNALRFMTLCLALVAWTGCAQIRVSDSRPQVEFAERRSDYLIGGTFSAETRSALFALGKDAARCEYAPRDCIPVLRGLMDPGTDATFSVLAELAIARALKAEQASRGTAADNVIGHYLDAALFAYAFLFLGDRTPGDRALEGRQMQVRDYYNLAAERVAVMVFQRTRGFQAPVIPVEGTVRAFGEWKVRVGQVDVRLPIDAERLDSIIAPSRLQIRGLRNIYRKDGMGAELVAVWSGDAKTQPESPMREIWTSPATVLLDFEGERWEDFFARQEVSLRILDPYQTRMTDMRGRSVRVAANFSAPFAVWLSRGDFQRRALLGTLGRDPSLTRPRVHLTQPFDPSRFTVILIHGLASGPKTWANVANELFGDTTLRDYYQLWQVQYPTSVPIAINHVDIRMALEQTLAALDPERETQATSGMVLIGHSMGGVLARLLILEGDDDIWRETLGIATDSEMRGALAPVEPYLQFAPIEGIGRAIFLASPHAGTPFAGNWLSRIVVSLIYLPVDTLYRIAAIADVVELDAPELAAQLRTNNTAIHQLNARNPFLQATSRLEIASGIPYHSVIARRSLGGPLEASNDGFVPFTSAYLPGARSTLVVNAGHSVHQMSEAIVEIRRILHEHLGSFGIVEGD